MDYFLTGLTKTSFVISIIAIVYMAISFIMKKKYTAKCGYYLWLVIILGFIVPLIPWLNLSPIEITIPRPDTNQVQVSLPEIESTVEIFFIENDFTVNILFIILFLSYIIWIIGFFAIIFSYIYRYCKFLRIANRWSETIKSKEMLDIFQKRKEEINISKNIYFKECSYISSPMMFGFLKPTILLPIKNYSSDELSYIIKHELMHYKQKDLWYKLLILLTTALHWFNPIIYKVAKKISIQCELSCDESVMKNENIQKRKVYSQIILNATKQDNKAKAILTTNFYGSKKDIKGRIFSIFDTHSKKKGFTVICTLCILIIFATTTTIAFAEHIDIQWTKTEYKKDKLNKEIAKELATYETHGLIYNSDLNALYYKDEVGRLSEDKLSNNFIQSVSTDPNSNGFIDMLAIRNEKNKVVGLLLSLVVLDKSIILLSSEIN